MPKNSTERRDATLLNHVIEIKEELARNTVETKNINLRLDKLNGSNARHETDIQLLKETAAANAISLNEMKKKEEGSSATWRRASDKILWGAVAVACMLFYRLLVETGIIKDFLN